MRRDDNGIGQLEKFFLPQIPLSIFPSLLHCKEKSLIIDTHKVNPKKKYILDQYDCLLIANNKRSKLF